MLIGIISDSHFEDFTKPNHEDSYLKLLMKLNNLFANVDHIIHAGDVCTKDFVRVLEKIAPTSVVMGNMDEFFNIKIWPRTMVLEFGGVSIGIAHRPEDIILFKSDEIRVFICGHTHIPSINENSDGILILNPGSIRKPRHFPKKYLFKEEENPRPTIAFLEINDGVISSFIKKL